MKSLRHTNPSSQCCSKVSIPKSNCLLRTEFCKSPKIRRTCILAGISFQSGILRRSECCFVDLHGLLVFEYSMTISYLVLFLVDSHWKSIVCESQDLWQRFLVRYHFVLVKFIDGREVEGVETIRAIRTLVDVDLPASGQSRFSRMPGKKVGLFS